MSSSEHDDTINSAASLWGMTPPEKKKGMKRPVLTLPTNEMGKTRSKTRAMMRQNNHDDSQDDDEEDEEGGKGTGQDDGENE